MDDTTQVETASSSAPSNESGTTTAPIQDNRSSAELEAIRKELEQSRMRANQLANQLEDKAKAEAEAVKKQLEEKEEFKTLYEQTQSRLRDIEESQKVQEREKELTQATETIFKDYSSDVVDVAKTAGLSLADDSEASITALKEKLDTFKAKFGGANPSPTSNNNHNPVPSSTDRNQLVNRQNRFEGSPMSQASAKGDDTIIRQYIHDHPAIQKMKDIAQNGV